MSTNDLGSEDTLELIQIDYYGKEYVVDNNTKDVYEKVGEGYEIVGTLIRIDPIEITFSKKPDWTEEYEDIEPVVFQGVEYMVNPKTHNVFLLNTKLGDYEYVGQLTSMKPIKIHLDLTKEDREEDEVELEVIESHGKKYIKDSKNNVYDIKQFEIIGTWNDIDNELDFIPTRGFLNINNSCFIDSVLFALLYRNNKFINKFILKKDIDKIKISNPDVVKALKKNQEELVRLYKWLHNIEQEENTGKVCVPFRKAYSQVVLGKNSGAFHNSDFETRMGDSAEFLFTIFNGFNVKTLVKETISYGKLNDDLVEITRNRETIAPIILVNAGETNTNYFQKKEVSTTPFSIVSDMSASNSELFNNLETLIRFEKIKILLQYLQRKTRIPKKEKDEMNKRLEKVKPDQLTMTDSIEIEEMYIKINKTLIQKELREVERIYEENQDLNILIIKLQELKEANKKHYSEKVDETTYTGVSDYIVLSIDRTVQSVRGLKRDNTPFNIQETINTPIGTTLELQFVVKYTDVPKHYMCYFKSIDDDMWYLYNDVDKVLRIVSNGKDDKEAGSFECMKENVASSCTLLFYSK